MMRPRSTWDMVCEHLVRNRVLVVLSAFCALYWHTLTWGWVGMDDSLLLRLNPHLGHSWHALWWALTDVEWGRRWLPVVWSMANLCSGAGAFGFRAGTFVLGAGLVASVTHVVARHYGEKRALVAGVLFCASPLRYEIFGWGIGFIYVMVGLGVVWSFHAWKCKRYGWAAVGAVAAVVVYPIAAGYALWLGYVSKRWIRWGIWGAVAGLFVFQYAVRVNIGYVPMAWRWSWVWDCLPHYLFVVAVPIGTTPIIPAGSHWGCLLAVAVGGLWLAASPRTVAVWVVVCSPILLAALNESFWFGARYAMLPGLCIMAIALERRESCRSGLAALACVVAYFSTSVLGGWATLGDAFARTEVEATALYGAHDWREMIRPEAFKDVYSISAYTRQKP